MTGSFSTPQPEIAAEAQKGQCADSAGAAGRHQREKQIARAGRWSRLNQERLGADPGSSRSHRSLGVLLIKDMAKSLLSCSNIHTGHRCRRSEFQTLYLQLNHAQMKRGRTKKKEERQCERKSAVSIKKGKRSRFIY